MDIAITRVANNLFGIDQKKEKKNGEEGRERWAELERRLAFNFFI